VISVTLTRLSYSASSTNRVGGADHQIAIR
jgi:hypothetical protein